MNEDEIQFDENIDEDGGHDEGALIKKLRAKIKELEEKNQEYLTGWQRAKADYLNLKKEEDKMAKETVAWANASIMSEILPVYNHFKLAMSHVSEDQKKESWVQGVMMIQKQFAEFLKRYGISEIKTVGEKFDPNLHEALTHEEHENFEPDVIFEEVSPGYLLEDKVLMPAKVKVTK